MQQTDEKFSFEEELLYWNPSLMIMKNKIH